MDKRSKLLLEPLGLPLLSGDGDIKLLPDQAPVELALSEMEPLAEEVGELESKLLNDVEALAEFGNEKDVVEVVEALMEAEKVLPRDGEAAPVGAADSDTTVEGESEALAEIEAHEEVSNGVADAQGEVVSDLEVLLVAVPQGEAVKERKKLRVAVLLGDRDTMVEEVPGGDAVGTRVMLGAGEEEVQGDGVTPVALSAAGSATVVPSKKAFSPTSTSPQHCSAPLMRAPQKPYAT